MAAAVEQNDRVRVSDNGPFHGKVGTAQRTTTDKVVVRLDGGTVRGNTFPRGSLHRISGGEAPFVYGDEPHRNAAGQAYGFGTFNS